MNIKIIHQPLQGQSTSEYIISSVDIDNMTEVNFLDKYDYSLKRKIIIDEEVNLASIYDNFLILYHYDKNGYYRIDLNTYNSSFINSNIVPEFRWRSGVGLYLDREEVKYKCLKKGELTYSFEPAYPISIKWSSCGILFYQNNKKEDNWLSMLDPENGKEIWRREFEWKISRVEHRDNYIILHYSAYENIRQDKGYEGQRDWYNPNYYVLCIDGETGAELWRTDGSFIKLNRKLGTVLIADVVKKEVDIETGRVIAQMNEKPKNKSGILPHFSDEQFFYYLSNDHEFGKYNKFTGEIVWEFNLIDDKGQKRMLSDWLVLGNGNLVLQTLPNHPDGDFTCIFNPEENMEFSKVKNGVRI